MNWIDGIIVAVIGFYVIEGWEQGIFRLGTSLISFLASLWLAVRWHQAAGTFLVEKFGVPPVWSAVLGYTVVAVVGEIVISELVTWMLTRLPDKIRTAAVNRWLGAVLSTAKGLVIVTLGLLLFLVLPLRGTIRQDIKASYLGNLLVNQVEKYAGGIKSSFDQAAQQLVKFITIEPKSNQRLNLDVFPQESNLKPDPAGEQQMFGLVNQERVKAGAKPLTWDTRLVQVGREHSQDMFVRHYFSHISPEGKDVGDRLTAAGVDYQEAGENLAYAPDVATAHQGLMNSEGHRKNILNPDFHRLGIGVINAGVNGLMITQVFTN